ncbi:hypothetical protein [Paenibacillus polymyxa]|uniref:hypothetical protein n=1 Tax=Paenibacillus polymyxa TaxID=1406 RepID=UPI000AE1EEFC
MKRVWTGTAITLAVIGSGLILFAGGQRSEPQEEWSLLNHKVEHALAIESESIESQRSSEYTQGKHAVKEASDQTERRANVEAVDNVKHNTKQSSTGLSAKLHGGEFKYRKAVRCCGFEIRHSCCQFGCCNDE